MLTSFAGGSLFGVRTSGALQVLALHGWGGSSSQLSAAMGSYSGISLDLPGFGASQPPVEAWGAEQYAKAVLPVLDEFESPPVVLGFSFGGRIAVNLAAAFPEKVGALVLTGAPLLRKTAPAARPSAKFRLMRRANHLGLVSDDRMEAERRKRGSADYRNASGVMRDVLVRAVNETYEAQLSQISCHVEMVWGADDTAAPVEAARRASELIRDVNLVVVEGRTHFLPIEEPAAVTAAIGRCL